MQITPSCLLQYLHWCLSLFSCPDQVSSQKSFCPLLNTITANSEDVSCLMQCDCRHRNHAKQNLEKNHLYCDSWSKLTDWQEGLCVTPPTAAVFSTNWPVTLSYQSKTQTKHRHMTWEKNSSVCPVIRNTQRARVSSETCRETPTESIRAEGKRGDQDPKLGLR